MNRAVFEYRPYEQPEHKVKATDGTVQKTRCQKEKSFGPKKSRTKLATEATKAMIQALSITFLLDGIALCSQLVYSEFNIAK